MATYGLSAPRRKLSTYGKGSSSKPSANSQYDLFGEPSSPETAKPRSPAKRTWDAGLAKPSATGKLLRTSQKKADGDIFDVPSSDDESVAASPSKSRLPNRDIQSKAATGSKADTTAKPVGKTGSETSEQSGNQNTAPRKRKRVPSSLNTLESSKSDGRHVKSPERHKPAPVKTTIQRLHASRSPIQANSAQSKVHIRQTNPKQLDIGSNNTKKSSPASTPPSPTASTSKCTPPPPAPPPPSSSSSIHHRALTTPPPRGSVSPGGIISSGAITPKQTALWSKLLDESGSIESPGDVSISKLRLTATKPRDVPRIQVSSPDIPSSAKRVRLVDTLKQSAGLGEENELEESESDGDSDDETFTMEVDDVTQSQSSTAPVLQMSSKITYGGQERSYLEEKDEEAVFDLLMGDLTQTSGGLGSQGQDPFDEELEDENTQGHPKTVHDLRAAGSKMRLLHALESLVAGVEGEGFDSMSSRRSSLLELATKLLEPEAVATLLDRGLERQLVKTFVQSSDVVFNFLGTIVVILLVKGADNLAVLRNIQQSACQEAFFGLFDYQQDISSIAKDRRSNMSRIAQSSVSEFKTLLLASEEWPLDKDGVLSPQITALGAIEQVIRRMRELKSDEVVLDEKSTSALITLVESQLSADSRPSKPDMRILPLTLSALESSSVAPASRGRSPWSPKLLKSLARFIPTILSGEGEPSSENRLKNLGLRICLNLTNNNARACDIFGSEGLIEALMSLIVQRFSDLTVEQDSSLELDELILSLGAMINLAELSDKARASAIANGDALMSKVVRVFHDGLEKTNEAESEEATRKNIPYGYLALLLVNLSQDDQVRGVILKNLPGDSLDAVINAAEQFIKIHQKTDRVMLEDEEGAEVHETYTNRLMGMVQRLRVVDGGF